MLKLIRQLVQKLKKDIKVETQDSSSHSNGNTHVVCSQNEFISNGHKEITTEIGENVKIGLFNFLKNRH